MEGPWVISTITNPEDSGLGSSKKKIIAPKTQKEKSPWIWKERTKKKNKKTRKKIKKKKHETIQ